MIKNKFARCVAVFCGISATLMSTPASAGIFGGLFEGCCLAKQCATPTFAASPCAPQVAKYVPTTCYRPVSVQVPVTTYSPVTSCDPCSGCPVTCMKPTTCLQTQTQMVPYTTYRLVITNPCGSSCGSALCPQKAEPALAAAPTTTYAPVTSSGCSTCGTGAQTTYAAPTTTNYVPSTTTYQSSPATTQGYTVMPGTTTTYSVSPSTTTTSPTAAPPQTFQNNGGSSNGSSTETHLRPIPQPGPTPATPSAGTSITPQLIDPANRTTMAPVTPAYSKVAWTAQADDSAAPAAKSEWRASNR